MDFNMGRINLAFNGYWESSSIFFLLTVAFGVAQSRGITPYPEPLHLFRKFM
jgi:hypothetical protein